MARQTIGFGGSCHWCTEAIFQSLIGVVQVKQGWIGSKPPNEKLSEAVLVSFDPKQITLETLIEIHLFTHSCTSAHTMREKYRSAVYYLNGVQKQIVLAVIAGLKKKFPEEIITQVIPFKTFELNKETYLNYYQNNPEKPFCVTYIGPKLKDVIERYADQMK
jgi:peptide-methionine (S)-S-oxide reductase